MPLDVLADGPLAAFIGPVAEKSGNTGWAFWTGGTCWTGGTFFFVPFLPVAGLSIFGFFKS